jgi:hypothetical protein
MLNSQTAEYMNVITLNCMPEGPLRSMVGRMPRKRLSEFVGWSDHDRCMHVLTRYPVSGFSAKRSDAFMVERDIPAVLQYLKTHGYHVDSDTRYLLKQPSLRRLIAMVSMSS